MSESGKFGALSARGQMCADTTLHSFIRHRVTAVQASGKRRAKHSLTRDTHPPPSPTTTSVGLCQSWKQNMYLSSGFQRLDLTFAISLIPSYFLHQTADESLNTAISIVRKALSA